MTRFSPITLGESRRKISNGRIVVTESVHEPNLSLSPHSHRNANLACVLKGSYTEQVERRRFECISESVLLKPAGAVHIDQYHKAGAHCLIIEILPELAGSFEAGTPVLDDVRLLDTGEITATVARLRRESAIDDDASAIAIEGLTLELLASLRRDRRGREIVLTPRWLRQAEEYIRSNFTAEISLSCIAKTVAVDPSHLTRVFRKRFNCSVGEYVRHLRVEYAAEQLLKTDMSLAEIAACAGFYDQSHFTKIFKRSFGTTPGEYRARLSRPPHPLQT